jgi:pimeloyl-ACP methyl ester carboxylesterase
LLSHADLAEIAADVYRGPWSARVALDLREDYLPREGELVVAIRGTDPLNALNWLRDVSAWPMWTPGIGLLHQGFASGALACWADAAPKMRRLVPVSYVGHSLGGAIALIMAALHAIHRPDQPFRVVTIGAPRPCLALASRLSWLIGCGQEAVEYARHGDVVPDLPLPPLYRHPLSPTLIGANAGEIVANHAAERYAADLRALNL